MRTRGKRQFEAPLAERVAADVLAEARMLPGRAVVGGDLDLRNAVDAQYDGYWMKTAYRIPDNDCACVEPGGKPDNTRPITRLNVRSFVTSHQDGAVVRGPVALRGIAFSGGDGIAQVEVSGDDGATWQQARLGDDLGGYSFREWRLELPLATGTHRVKVRASTPAGETQPLEPRWQPPGYMRNVVETVTLEVA